MASERSTIFSLVISLLVLMFFNSLSGKCDAAAMKYDLHEAEALLKWKGSLLQSEALLHSWSLPTANGSPCNWTGITCNDDGKVKEINLSNCSLQGTEYFYPEAGEQTEEVQADQPDDFLEYSTDGIV